ncbi:porin family protein [Vibrio nomapromontoriensis]|uniref:porin family protein n=1 Tax=Vibrio nomapromontoriensis TaxID=2910246 RepID=UPI003D0AD590
MNITKKAAVLALTIISAPALSNDGFYIGAEASINNNVEFKPSTGALSGDSALGFNVNAGYEFHLSTPFTLGVEASYHKLGEATIDLAPGIEGKSDVSALFINVKPKYYVGDTGLYVAGTIGAGQVDATLEGVGGKGTGYQYGVETGYAFSENVSVGLGYRVLTTSVSDDQHGDIDVSSNGFYIGTQYKF